MAQIIQVLAMSQWDEIDPKVRDIYGKFEKVSPEGYGYDAVSAKPGLKA